MDDVSIDLSFGDFNVTVEEKGIASTPVKPRQTRSRRGTAAALPSPANAFKAPAPPKSKPKGPVLATCEKCGAEYRTLRYYKRHIQGHQLKDLASRVPDITSIQQNCQDIGAKTIEKLLAKPTVFGKKGAAFQELLSCIKIKIDTEEWKEIVAFLTQRFCVLLSAEKFCMPSALIVTELAVVDSILTTISDRDNILLRLGSIAICEDNECDSFLAEFVLTFGDQLLIFIFRCLRNSDSMSHRESVDEFDVESRQCIFYIGGCIFRRIRLFGARCSKSKKWKAITEVIDKNIIEDDFYDVFSEQHQEDRLWTEQMNRGGLKFVKQPIQSFLLSIARVILQLKKPDGSLPLEEILNQVVVSAPKFLWDEAIGNNIDEDTSLALMVGAAKKLVSTFSKGIIYDIMNAANNNNKATISITLRHKVAPH